VRHDGAVTVPPEGPPGTFGQRGRGLVITGAVLVGLYLLPAVAMMMWFLWGLSAASQAMSMIFPFWLAALLALAPLWEVGIALLGLGRSQQRGSVRAAPLAWILALGGMPVIGVLMVASIGLLSAGQDTLGGVSFTALVIGIPVLTLLALLSGAWLTWGRPRVG